MYKISFSPPHKTNAAEIFQDRPFGRHIGLFRAHMWVVETLTDRVCVRVCVCVVERLKEYSLGSVKKRKTVKILSLSHYLLRYKYIQPRILEPYTK